MRITPAICTLPLFITFAIPEFVHAQLPEIELEMVEQEEIKDARPSPTPKPIAQKNSKKLKRQILESLDEPDLEAGVSNDFVEEPWFSGFRISKKGPIQYRRTLRIGDDEVSLKIYGPVIKKKPGLRIMLEGLHIGNHSVRMEGYGNTKEGGFRLTVRF